MVQRKRKTTTPKRKSPKRTRRTSPKKKRRTSPRRKRMNVVQFDTNESMQEYLNQERMKLMKLMKLKLIVSAIKDRYGYILRCFLQKNGDSEETYNLFIKIMNKRIIEEKGLLAFNKIPNYTVDETYRIKQKALNDLLDDVYYS